MGTFIYYSVIIVGLIMLVRFGWDVFKFAVKAWYTIFAFIIVGVIIISVILPACVKFILY